MIAAVALLVVLVALIAWVRSLERDDVRRDAPQTLGTDITLPASIGVPARWRKEHW